MRSQSAGTDTLEAEVLSISRHGFWLLIGQEELFLPFEQFPWFRSARVDSLLNVRLVGPEHLHWPDLDVDLTIASIRSPEQFPLLARVD